MENKVFLDGDEFIHIVSIGNQTYETVKAVQHEIERLSGEMAKKNKQIKILDDLRQMGKENMMARKAAFDILKKTKYYKIAIIGLSPVTRNLAGLIVQAAGKTQTVKIFREESEAVRWLKMNEPEQS